LLIRQAINLSTNRNAGFVDRSFTEVNNDTKSVDAKVWLLNKQTKNWPTTKATTEAVYALLLQDSDWLSVKDNTDKNR
jgi:hypothetical protein